ncbi:hypothetical protein [Metaclostridioides mangenotii]|uniref:Transmembrane protein n=1 Tax=Metaclostridioides mangenotii TaxID=1540 RepID=A0ABS4EEJ8_9FIRM|nr:hypothetical protein [Clostridioides mangenotii]MBP1856369.1 hypothetical protein [Clostridioides mangenotii]
MSSKRKFKRDYIILEAKDINFRNKERVLPKAFAKVEVNDGKSIVALYVENLKYIKDGYDTLAITTKYDVLDLGKIVLNDQGRGEFILDLDDEEDDIKSIAIVHEDKVPLIGFKGNKLDNYEDILFAVDEDEDYDDDYDEEYDEEYDEDGEDNEDDYDESLDSSEGYDDDLDLGEGNDTDEDYDENYNGDNPSDHGNAEDIASIRESGNFYENEGSDEVSDDDSEYEVSDGVYDEDVSDEEYSQDNDEEEYDDHNDNFDEYDEFYDEEEEDYLDFDDDDDDVFGRDNLDYEENDDSFSQNEKISNDEMVELNNFNKIEYRDKYEDNSTEEKDDPLKYVSNRKKVKNKSYKTSEIEEVKEEITEQNKTVGTLMMPRQIKKGLKYFKEVKPFVEDKTESTRWWKIDINPTTLCGYSMPNLGYVNALNYTMYSDVVINAYKHRHYLFGVQYDEYNKRKNYIYAIPGLKNEKPDNGNTGFVRFESSDNRSNNSMGYWMCFIDARLRTIVK